MRPVDGLLGGLLVLVACRTGSTGRDAPAPEEPAQASSQPAEAPLHDASAVVDTPSDAERAAVDAACKELDRVRKTKSCEATHHLGEFIIVKARWKRADRHSDAWYIVMRVEGEYRFFEEVYIPPGGESEPVTSPQAICNTDAPADGPPPSGTGIVRAEMRDLSLDGRDDLLIECRSETVIQDQRVEGHYLQICVSSGPECHGRIWLHRAEDGHVDIDVDVKFVDGWVRRTERVYNEPGARGDIQLSDPKKQPSPAPP